MKLNYKKISGILAAMTLAFIGFSVSLQAATLSDLVIGGYIAYAGGHIRHKEFRFEPPPPPRAEEHHHEYEH